MVVESVHFFQVYPHDQRLGVNFISRVQGVFICISRSNFLCLLLSFSVISWFFNSDKNIIGRSLKHLTGISVQFTTMLVIKGGESVKSHSVGLTAPVELLLWEFKPVIITNAHGNIVIGFDSADTAPEE